MSAGSPGTEDELFIASMDLYVKTEKRETTRRNADNDAPLENRPTLGNYGSSFGISKGVCFFGTHT